MDPFSISAKAVGPAARILQSTWQKRRQRDRPFDFWILRGPANKPWELALHDRLSDERAVNDFVGDPEAARKWLYEIGAWDFLTTRFRLFLRARGPKPVSLISLRVDVKKRYVPAMGSLVSHPDAGSQIATVLYCQLGSRNPILQPARLADGQITPIDTYSWGDGGNRVDLVAGEAHEFLIHAESPKMAAEWTILMDVVVGDKFLQFEITDDGAKSFFTSGGHFSLFQELWSWAWWEPPGRFEQGTTGSAELAADPSDDG